MAYKVGMILILVAAFLPQVTSLESSCGNNICERGGEWSPSEDVSTCFSDCKGNTILACQVNRETGSTCDFQGRSYQLKINVSNVCSPDNTQATVEADFGPHNTQVRMLTGEWKTLHDDVRVHVGGVPCRAYTTSYDVHLASDCEGDCSTSANLKVKKSEYLTNASVTNYNVGTKLSISEDLRKPVCEYVLRREGEEVRTRTGTCDGYNFGVPKRSMPEGNYSITINVLDNAEQHTIAHDTANFRVVSPKPKEPEKSEESEKSEKPVESEVSFVGKVESFFKRVFDSFF